MTVDSSHNFFHFISTFPSSRKPLNMKPNLCLAPAAKPKLEELRRAVERDQNKSRPKFSVKILRILKHSVEHPEDVSTIGAGFCTDKIHFICNSIILGHFLGLKANSINTNFRAHSFAIDNIGIEDIPPEYGNLPDPKHWKMRHNVKYHFAVDTTEFDAAQIPCIEPKVQSLDLVQTTNPPLPIFPPRTDKLLKDNPIMRQDINALIDKSFNKDTGWKSKFLGEVTKNWLSMTNSIDPIKPINIIRMAMSVADPAPPDDFRPLIEENLTYLLSASCASSQIQDEISFLDFTKFCLRFGTIERHAQSIFEVSDPMYKTQQFQWAIGSQSDLECCFAKWFLPSTDQNHALLKLKSGGLKWVVKLSGNQPDTFTIQVLQGNKFIATHIHFDPFPNENEKRFSVEFDEGEFQYANSWHEMLVNILNLTIPHEKSDPIDRPSLQFVNASALVSSDKPPVAKIVPVFLDDIHFSIPESPKETFGSQLSLTFTTSQTNLNDFPNFETLL